MVVVPMPPPAVIRDEALSWRTPTIRSSWVIPQKVASKAMPTTSVVPKRATALLSVIIQVLLALS
ncbi:hypothetical protein IMSAGC019_01171 [Lachnospiraceae bacterium]|nr:hypothetical protein IMSAGC019_01171 [Lachnospiraceae bacterium]